MEAAITHQIHRDLLPDIAVAAYGSSEM